MVKGEENDIILHYDASESSVRVAVVSIDELEQGMFVTMGEISFD